VRSDRLNVFTPAFIALGLLLTGVKPASADFEVAIIAHGDVIGERGDGIWYRWHDGKTEPIEVP
jgi:hypothetical protein